MSAPPPTPASRLRRTGAMGGNLPPATEKYGAQCELFHIGWNSNSVASPPQFLFGRFWQIFWRGVFDHETGDKFGFGLDKLGFLAITAVTLVETDPSRAVPVNGSLIAAGLADISNVEQVRAFCYNTRTGAFSHWGRCRVVCNYYGPGGYCRKVAW